MNVFIVEQVHEYEPGNIIAVCATKEIATREAERKAKDGEYEKDEEDKWVYGSNSIVVYEMEFISK